MHTYFYTHIFAIKCHRMTRQKKNDQAKKKNDHSKKKKKKKNDQAKKRMTRQKKNDHSKKRKKKNDQARIRAVCQVPAVALLLLLDVLVVAAGLFVTDLGVNVAFFVHKYFRLF
jgi:Flp pilus assembly protein TadB